MAGACLSLCCTMLSVHRQEIRTSHFTAFNLLQIWDITKQVVMSSNEQISMKGVLFFIKSLRERALVPVF